MKMKFVHCSRKIHLSILLILLPIVRCQIMNRAPQFVPGSGDMARFSLSENTPVGSPIYQLRGKFPIHFFLNFKMDSIIGYFSSL